MTNELSVFSSEDFGMVRTVEINGVIWLVAKDICNIFGDTNYRRSITRLDEDEKILQKVQTKGGEQTMTLINESGLYSLLFFMQPKKAKGVSQNDTLIEQRTLKLKSFKRWITHEVIPSIRKTGSYSLSEESYKAIREKSKEIRNHFTAMQKAHGYTEKHEFIQTTCQMKKKLGITAKKDDMTKQELAAVSAAEWLSIAMITDENGFHEVNPVCVEASVTVSNAIENKQPNKLLA